MLDILFNARRRHALPLALGSARHINIERQKGCREETRDDGPAPLIVLARDVCEHTAVTESAEAIKQKRPTPIAFP